MFPEDFGLKREDIYIPICDRGVISGWFIANANSKKTIVLAHGFGMNKGEILMRTFFLAKEYNLFYFDFLGSGGSAGRTEVGYSEPEDIAAVINFLKKNKPQATEKIALYGLSQGAGAAVRYTSENKDISCLILEAVYFSFKNIAGHWIWNRQKVPYFPAVYIYLLLKEIRLKCDLDELSPKTKAPKVTAPVLLIHGAEDKISLPKNAQKVYDLLPGYKELWIVPEAGHTSCSKAAATEYENRLTAFLKNNF